MTTTSTRIADEWVGVCAVVDGVRRTAGAAYHLENPATGEILTSLTEPSEIDADEAVAVAAAVGRSWRQTSLSARQAVLARAAEVLAERRDDLVDAAVNDAGSLRSQAGPFQVDVGIDRLRWWASAPPATFHVPSPDPIGSLAVRVDRTPIGVVVCITPYNFPLVALASKVGPTLTAGNTIVVKPAPQDPLLACALVDALHTALREQGHPAGVVNLVLGSAAASGARLTEHRDVAGVTFTGSTTVGQAIYRSGALTMKRLLLELGGKGALIVRNDADLELAASAAARTWRYHAGQVCRTPARVIAHAGVHDELRDRLVAVGEQLRYGDPDDPATTIGPVISAVQHDRVEALIAGAAGEGQQLLRFGSSPDVGHVVRATLVLTDGPEPTIMQQEAFGPVLTLTRVADDEEAVALANATPYGLTDYVYSRDLAAAQKLGARLTSAQVHLNNTDRHTAAPFSGNRLSGVGRGGAPYSLDAYTNLHTTTYPIDQPS